MQETESASCFYWLSIFGSAKSDFFQFLCSEVSGLQTASWTSADTLHRTRSFELVFIAQVVKKLPECVKLQSSTT
jgi:hypothetical protein